MTAVSQSAKKKIKAGSFSLNRFGTGTQSVFHLVLAAFSLMCIIPFIFVIIIAFSSEESRSSFLEHPSLHLHLPAGECPLEKLL